VETRLLSLLIRLQPHVVPGVEPTMPYVKGLFATAFVALTLLAIAAPPATAEPRTRKPGNSNYDLCVIDQPNSETTSNSVVKLCCYTNGCWVCPNKVKFALSECRWFPVAKLQGGLPKHLNQLLQHFDQNLNYTPQTLGPTKIAPTAPARR